MGVLWRHSSVNLVKPGSIALASAFVSSGCRRSQKRLAFPLLCRNRRSMKNKWLLQPQFPINHYGMIQAFGFNDLAGINE